MFDSARIKLTAWYLVIIMLISTLFSAAIFQASTREIRRFSHRMQMQQIQEGKGVILPPRPPNAPTIEELENIRTRFLLMLVIINGMIFIFSGAAGYFLAGKTLYPIKVMIDEQNQFISDASHELRTPIATLRAEMEGMLLEKSITDKRARELIASNLEELSRLQELSNSLLQTAHSDTSNWNDDLEKISIREVVNSAVKQIAALAKKNQVDLSIKAQDSIVLGNKQKLIEVFVILLDNAIKYSKEQTKVLITSTKTDRHLVISILDSGMGISKEDLPHVFERFYRADKSRSRIHGYGLGLSIAKKIVELHNGSIYVKSTPNKGSTFSVSLPTIS